MVEVIKKGAYLVDGQIVYADQAQNVATPDEAREKTIAYSILRAHNKGKDPKKMQIKFDALISHDITFVGIIQTAKASGLKEAMRVLRNVEGIGICELTNEDVVRHVMVQRIVKAYEDYENAKNGGKGKK